MLSQNWGIIFPQRYSSDINTLVYLPVYRYRVPYRNNSIYTEYGSTLVVGAGDLLYGLDLLTLML